MRPRFPESPEEKAARLLRSGLQMRGGSTTSAVESTGGGFGGEEIASKLSARLASGGIAEAAAAPLARMAVDTASATLDAAAQGELTLGDMSSRQLASLEAVISVTGRPAWFVRRNVPVPEGVVGDRASEFWLVHLSSLHAKVKEACSRVGAIFMEEDGKRTSIGTGWVIDDGIVATNAHVARHLYFRRPVVAADDPADGWRVRGGVTGLIDFSFENEVEGSRLFRFSSRPRFIESDEAARPDLAFLALEPLAGQALPRRIEMERGPDRPGDQALVYVVGHPAADPNADSNVTAVFGALDGTKRLSPGRSLGLLGDFVIAHDCSTVNGSSGSPLLDFGTGLVVGHHYWGEPGARNEAVFLPAIIDHPAVSKALAGGFRS
jgi:S1-C subfamily serine protease